MLRLTLAALILLAAPLTAQAAPYEDSEDPREILLEEKLCANPYLRQSLQRSFGRFGDPKNANIPVLSCFRDAGRKVRVRRIDFLTALDNACIGHNIMPWVEDPETIPEMGCGDDYQQPEWKNIPLVRN